MEIDNTTQTFDAHTSESDILEDYIPPQPQYDPSCAATQADIPKLHPSLDNAKMYIILRFTSKDHKNTFIDNDADGSTSQSSDNDEHDTKHVSYMLDTNNKKETPNTT